MLLAGKKLLITGVLTPGSIAYDCARIAVGEGAEVVLTGFGRGMSLTQRSARRLTPIPDVLEVDVNEESDLVALTGELERRWGRLDGCLHAIAFAPADTMGGNFLSAPWESAEVALRTSTFSLKELACALAPLMSSGGSIGSLTFDNRVAYPAYDWMGGCKAGLVSGSRCLAFDLALLVIPFITA